MAQTHDDGDAREFLRRNYPDLEAKAKQMTEAQTNTIAAGAAGESPLWVRERPGFYIAELPSDPLAVRVSCGALHAGQHAYLTFRGDLDRVETVLRWALDAVKEQIVERSNKAKP